MSDSIRYTIGWSNPASQLYEVTVTARATGEPIVFSLMVAFLMFRPQGLFGVNVTRA